MARIVCVACATVVAAACILTATSTSHAAVILNRELLDSVLGSHAVNESFDNIDPEYNPFVVINGGETEQALTGFVGDLNSTTLMPPLFLDFGEGNIVNYPAQGPSLVVPGINFFAPPGSGNAFNTTNWITSGRCFTPGFPPQGPPCRGPVITPDNLQLYKLSPGPGGQLVPANNIATNGSLFTQGFNFTEPVNTVGFTVEFCGCIDSVTEIDTVTVDVYSLSGLLDQAQFSLGLLSDIFLTSQFVGFTESADISSVVMTTTGIPHARLVGISDITFGTVPEPSTLALFGGMLAIFGLVLGHRSRIPPTPAPQPQRHDNRSLAQRAEPRPHGVDGASVRITAARLPLAPACPRATPHNSPAAVMVGNGRASNAIRRGRRVRTPSHTARRHALLT